MEAFIQIMDILIILFLFAFSISVLFYWIHQLQKTWYYWLTLGFLPTGLQIRKGTSLHSWRIPVFDPFLNYFTACLINLIDALLWCSFWVPGVRPICFFFYRCPDMSERYLSWFFGGINGHRNFISHSTFNPFFLVLIWSFRFLIEHTTSIWLQLPLQIIGTLIGLSFIAHLMADTLPKAWLGKALIKVVFIFHFKTFSIAGSKFWLHTQALLAFCLFFWQFQLWKWFV